MPGNTRSRLHHCHCIGPAQVDPQGASVTVVGDTHGQFHDVCHMWVLVGGEWGSAPGVPQGWKVHSRVCISACDHVFPSLGPFSTIHCHRFKVAGYPSPASLFIFNGDFVDSQGFLGPRNPAPPPGMEAGSTAACASVAREPRDSPLAPWCTASRASWLPSWAEGSGR